MEAVHDIGCTRNSMQCHNLIKVSFNLSRSLLSSQKLLSGIREGEHRWKGDRPIAPFLFNCSKVREQRRERSTRYHEGIHPTETLHTTHIHICTVNLLLLDYYYVIESTCQNISWFPETRKKGNFPQSRSLVTNERLHYHCVFFLSRSVTWTRSYNLTRQRP